VAARPCRRTPALCDSDRADHFIRRNGRVFAGTHLIIEVVDGTGLDDEARIERAFRDCVDAAAPRCCTSTPTSFPPGRERRGGAGRKPHLVHTWPEIGYGAFDVFMCGDAEPWRAVDVLKAAFDTDDVRVTELRGALATVWSRRRRRAVDDHEWMQERLHPDYAQALRVDRLLYDSETDHQRLQVFENARFGRVLTLDDVVQTTEGDNFIYHEMMVHVPILAHGAARRVLIVGGGDGGMAREVLRHPGVEHVTMVEIDAGVVEFSKQYLPACRPAPSTTRG
jgi:S-adenosylmethionine/arginine decarboxylase-like enzyme